MVPHMLQLNQVRPANLALPASHKDLQVLLDPELLKALRDLLDLFNLVLLAALASPVLL